MAWRKPPKIAPRQLKRNACPDADSATAAAASAAASAEAAAASASAAVSLVDRLSKPKHNVEVIKRRNPKEVREEALAKARAAKLAKANAAGQIVPSARAKTPRAQTPKAQTDRVRTTVTKTTSTPGGASETTTVEKVESGPAKPRFNRKKVMHPEDAYKEQRRPIPCRPKKPCPKIKPKTVYPKDVRLLWEDWQRYEEFRAEVKCWKQNLPYVSKQEREEKRFAKWMKQEEMRHESQWLAGKTNIKPFHLREPADEKKKIVRKKRTASAHVKELAKSDSGKRRYLKKDCMGNEIRYNSVDDPHPEDVYELQGGMCVPPYVQPPLQKDGTFKKPKQMTDQEKEALFKYRKWEEFYFKVQSWEADKKWVGDPRIDAVLRIKTVGDTQGPDTTCEGRAEARAAERARRAQIRSGKKLTKAQMELVAALKKRGANKLSGAARVALESRARQEAKEAGIEEAKAQAIAERQRKFLRRGARESPALGRGKVNLKNVRSRISGLIRGSKAGAAADVCPPPAEPCPMPMQDPCPMPMQDPCQMPFQEPQPPAYVPPKCTIPFHLYERYEKRLRNRGINRRKYRELENTRRMLTDHMVRTGNKGDLTSREIFRGETWDDGAPGVSIQLAEMGTRPTRPVIPGDSTIFPYNQHESVCSNFGLPSDYDEDEVYGCDPMPEDWEAEDAPVTPMGARALRCRGLAPSPPKSLKFGAAYFRHPWHETKRARAQFRATGAITDYELEDPAERAFADRCAEYQINKPLLQRRQEMEARFDPNLLHPALYRSDLMGRMADVRAVQRQMTNLDRRFRNLDCDLPDIGRLPISRMENIPSPPCSPDPVGDILGIDEPCQMPQAALATPPMPPLPYIPPRVPSPVSPFQLPARFIPEMNNPYLQVAQRSIASLPAHIPYRGQEIADTFARVQAAARGPRQADLMGAWEVDDMCRDLAECLPMDESGEGCSRPTAARARGYRGFPDYHQCEGPQSSALYHEHTRRPQQYGPWPEGC